MYLQCLSNYLGTCELNTILEFVSAFTVFIDADSQWPIIDEYLATLDLGSHSKVIILVLVNMFLHIRLSIGTC